MLNNNSSSANNPDHDYDTPKSIGETIEESPFLSDFLREIKKLSKHDKKANYEYLEAHKKWLDELPKPLSDIESKKRRILNAYLNGALATRAES